tara:strand:+ start:1350 stop:2381 length:1032 start_codon:yes stop_codon:yes gene_type:complete
VYKSIIRPILFLFDPEKIHHFTFSFIKIVNKIPGVSAVIRAMFLFKDESLKRRVFGIDFPNPVGLAAGFDKDGKLFEELSNFGFGFIELGTVTPVAQDGNPLPRMFRLAKDKGLINRMGFNNKGVDGLVSRLKRRKSKSIIIGGNIGKNKSTPNSEALNDYLICFEKLFDDVDYFVVNVSSPNTPNLRDLQEKEPLTQLLKTLQAENSKKPSPKPILLKIAPDLSNGQLDDIIAIVEASGIAGVIATNTTISRENLKESEARIQSIGNGGLSGAPVRKRSSEVISYLHEKSYASFPIIAVGGIFTAEDAIEKLNAGASLVQVYTGFIYEGPGMIKKILKGIKA